LTKSFLPQSLVAWQVSRHVWTAFCWLFIVLGLLSLRYEIGLTCGSRCFIWVWGAAAGFDLQLVGDGADVWQTLSGIRTREFPLRFHRAHYGVYGRNQWVLVGLRAPVYVLVGVAFVFRWVSIGGLRLARSAKGLCAVCEYDLRGTPSDRCSECGSDVGKQAQRLAAWAHPSAARLVVLYFTSAVAWTAASHFYYSMPWKWWPDAGVCVGFLAQLCGPFVYAVESLCQFPFPHIDIIVSGASAVLTWSAFTWVLVRTRLRTAPMVVHLLVFILWVCVGNVIAGLVLWLIW